MDISPTTEADLTALDKLYATAFPDEPLAPLVRALLGEAEPPLSLAARADGALIGHVMFSPARVGEAHRAAMLAPLGVLPEWQRRGVGSALVRAGLAEVWADGVTTVLVLGDPAYYGRFGFVPERGVRPPYPMPAQWADAWQSLVTGEAPVGPISLSPTWMQPSLWGS